MALEALITAAATGAVVGLGKVVEVLVKRRKNGTLRRHERQMDRLEAKVDLLNEAQLETQHRIARLEQQKDETKPVDLDRRRVNGVPR